MIYFLFGIVILFFIISFFITRDIFSPSCILCESYILAIFFAMLNISKWSINLGNNTVILIIIGILSFLIPANLFYMYYKIKKKDKSFFTEETLEKVREKKKIEYKKFFLYILIFVELIITIVYIAFVFKQIGGISSFSQFSNAMTKYRYAISYDSTIQVPTLIKQGTKLTKAIIYVFTYIEIHNFIFEKVNKKKYKISKLLIGSIVLFAIQAILTGGRTELIIYFIYALMISYIIYNTYFNTQYKTKGIKSILKIVLIFFIVIYLFSSVRTIFGRNNQDSFIDYVSRYFGGSIELLDLYMKEPIVKSDILGKETFEGINKMLNSLGIIDASYTIHLEFRIVNGINLGNVYTSFRRMYQDFGYIGVFILQIILASIYSIFYERVKNKKNIDYICISVIMYAVIIHGLFLNSFSDFFYSTILSINYINILFYIVFVKFFITKIKV